MPCSKRLGDLGGLVVVRTLPARLLWRIGQAAFLTDDEYARKQGWDIKVGRFGLSRTYRHSRFGQLTGRVTVSQSSPRGKQYGR